MGGERRKEVPEGVVLEEAQAVGGRGHRVVAGFMLFPQWPLIHHLQYTQSINKYLLIDIRVDI
jgi:hypothetical protein